MKSEAKILRRKWRWRLMRVRDGTHRPGHVTYGAEAAHYDAVGDCLLRALTVTAGRMWNEELTVAWSEAYSTVAGIMKRCTGEPGRAQTSRSGTGEAKSH